jgi:Glycoside-hydrolase family GH114
MTLAAVAFATLASPVRADVATLHKAGRKVVCYVDAGSYEKGRPDAKRFRRVDGYTNDSGFPLTAADQLTYNRRVAISRTASGSLSG